jgi:hypothetical protein
LSDGIPTGMVIALPSAWGENQRSFTTNAIESAFANPPAITSAQAMPVNWKAYIIGILRQQKTATMTPVLMVMSHGFPLSTMIVGQTPAMLFTIPSKSKI